MALSGKYGKVNVAKIPEEEPVFILRAQDKLALPIIEMYRVLAVFHESGVAPALQKEIGDLTLVQDYLPKVVVIYEASCI